MIFITAKIAKFSSSNNEDNNFVIEEIYISLNRSKISLIG